MGRRTYPPGGHLAEEGHGEACTQDGLLVMSNMLYTC